MPNRIIKETICTSETIDKMSQFEENFFYRLIVNCDDYGRMDARPAILKAKLFPLKERLPLKEVQNALNKLAGIGCVELYEVEQKPYLYFPAWSVHQRIRNSREKYPSPDRDNSRRVAASCGELRPESNPIQSESNIYSRVISFLNEKAGTQYKHTTAKTKTCIDARMKEGFTIDNFKTVISKKVAEWKGTDMEKFLRPETLFGTKFEGYLNQKTKISEQTSGLRDMTGYEPGVD